MLPQNQNPQFGVAVPAIVERAKRRMNRSWASGVISNGILSSVVQSRYQSPDFNFGVIVEHQFYSFSLTMVIVG